MTPVNKYFDAVTSTLITFQYIEETLKMVLIRYECLIFFRIKSYTHYNLKPKFSSIENSALGRLIDQLQTFTEDKDFLKQLRDLKKQRDQIAHQSMLMTIEEQSDDASLEDKTKLMVDTNKEAKSLLQDMVERWKDLDKTLDEVSRGDIRPDKPSK